MSARRQLRLYTDGCIGVPSIIEQFDRDASTLNLLAAVDGLRGAADRATRLLVRSARAEGASWSQIGAALRMTKQAAWERFCSDVNEPNPPEEEDA